MDFKDEIETSLSSLARKIQYILAVQLFAKRWKTARENMRARWGNSKLTYISSKRRLKHNFHRQLFRKLISFKKSICKIHQMRKKELLKEKHWN